MQSRPAELNAAAVQHARQLIAEGQVSDTSPWSPPSAELGDELIERDGIEAYGVWFLSTHPDTDPQTKGHYGFPISHDFVTVDIAGLRAAESRAAEWKHQDVEQAAKELYQQAESAKG